MAAVERMTVVDGVPYMAVAAILGVGLLWLNAFFNRIAIPSPSAPNQ
jgi:hypothetical protein